MIIILSELRLRSAGVLVVLMEAEQRGGEVEAGKQLARVSRILRQGCLHQEAGLI